ncbi:MAG: ribosome silencing factor [Candidatus Krumholzibacteria bacterium]|nr:ribosome silencing factor [Candidatus Krumholzibacteria bacterium]
MTATNDDTERDPAPPTMPDESAGFLLAERAAYHLLTLKGEDVVILDLRRLSDVCDFFVIGCGHADTQVKAMARSVRTGLAGVGQKPAGSEGEADGRWVLLDFVDVVVHVFRPEVRQYYQLERLWGDARFLAVTERHVQSDEWRRRHPDLALTGPSSGSAAME